MRAVIAALILAGSLVGVFWAGADAGARSERALRARASEPLAGVPSDLEAALGIADAAARAHALASLLKRSGPADVDTLFQVIDATNLPVDPVALVILADWAAGLDPRDAFRRVGALRNRDSYAAAYAVVRRWARQDPAEARRAVEAVNDPRGLDPLYEALVMGWAERLGDQAPWAFVEAMPMGVTRQKLIQTLVGRKMVVEGVEPTLRYVESLPDDAARRFKLQVFRRAAHALARQDPERAVAWALQHSDGPNGDGMLRKVGTARVALEGAAGFEWLRGAAAGPQRDEAVTETYRRWLMADRAAALAWLGDAPHDPAFEPALVLLVGATARRDPREALELVARIRDPGLAQGAKLRLGSLWLKRDAEAATRWIRESGLSEELQTQLLEGRVDGGLPTRQLGRRDA
jgi:hypothetical protein